MKNFRHTLTSCVSYMALAALMSSNVWADSEKAEAISGIVEFGETLEFNKGYKGGPDSLHVVTTVRPFQQIALKIYGNKGAGVEKTEIVSDIALPSSRKIQRLAAEVYDKESKIVDWPYICMVEPTFPRSLSRGLWVADDKTITPNTRDIDASFLEVLSPTECWIGYSLEPSDRGASEKAHQLKGMIQGLRDEVLYEHFKVGS